MFFLRRRRKKTPAAIAARTAIPPTTPPAIAPTFVDDPLSLVVGNVGPPDELDAEPELERDEPAVDEADDRSDVVDASVDAGRLLLSPVG